MRWHNIDGWCDDCEAGVGDCRPVDRPWVEPYSGMH